MDYGALKVGHAFPPAPLVLEAEKVAKYLEAVGDRNHIYRGVPPTALAALALKALMDNLSLPPGTLHTSQELEFLGLVYVGEKLVCQAKVVQNSVRGGRRFLTVELEVAHQEGGEVLAGRTSLILPA